MSSIGVFKSKRMSRKLLLDYEEKPDAPKIVIPLSMRSSVLTTLEDTVGVIGTYLEGHLDDDRTSAAYFSSKNLIVKKLVRFISPEQIIKYLQIHQTNQFDDYS